MTLSDRPGTRPIAFYRPLMGEHLGLYWHGLTLVAVLTVQGKRHLLILGRNTFEPAITSRVLSFVTKEDFHQSAHLWSLISFWELTGFQWLKEAKTPIQTAWVFRLMGIFTLWISSFGIAMRWHVLLRHSKYRPTKMTDLVMNLCTHLTFLSNEILMNNLETPRQMDDKSVTCVKSYRNCLLCFKESVLTKGMATSKPSTLAEFDNFVEHIYVPFSRTGCRIQQQLRNSTMLSNSTISRTVLSVKTVSWKLWRYIAKSCKMPNLLRNLAVLVKWSALSRAFVASVDSADIRLQNICF